MLSFWLKVVEFFVAKRFYGQNLETLSFPNQKQPTCMGILGVGIPLPSGYMHECKLPTASYVITTGLDLQIQYADAG